MREATVCSMLLGNRRKEMGGGGQEERATLALCAKLGSDFDRSYLSNGK